jgi:putative membrane protein
MFLFVLIFWAVVIVAGVAVIRWLFAAPPGRLPAPGETAEDILKKRYARGEIQKDEYEAKLRDLRN